ncbi:MAG: tetratricopeptide repeat protein [Nitrospinota bacterium]
MDEEKIKKLFSHISKPVILVERNRLALLKIVKVLKDMNAPKEKVRLFKDISSAVVEMKNIVNSGMDVDIIISDIFYNDEINLIRLVAEMEKIPRLWNTPLLVFTNETGEEMYNEIRNNIVHVPFRFISKSSLDQKIKLTLMELIDFRSENHHFLELETKVTSFINTKNVAMLKPTMDMIMDYKERFPVACGPAKIDLLCGKLHYDFSAQLTAEMKEKVEQLQNFSPESSDFGTLQAELTKLSATIDDLNNTSYQFYLSSYNQDPTYWKALYSLYLVNMERRDLGEAKKYLSKLIGIFPNNSSYYFKMGKINELQNDLSAASERYLESAKMALQEGVQNVKEEDVVDIVNASIKAGKNLLMQLDADQIDRSPTDHGSERGVIMQTLRKNNALARASLLYLAKKNPGNADYLNKIGITYRRIGDYQKACQAYSQAVAIDYNNARIRINNAAALGLCGAWKASLAEISEAKKVNDTPDDEIYLDKLEQIIRKKDLNELKKVLL